MSTDGSAGSTASEAQMAEWARTLTADPTAPVHRELGAALLAGGSPKRAALVLAAALHHHPDDVPGRLLLGEAQIAAGEPHDCAREMARVLAVQPNSVDALLLLARSLRLVGQYDEAAVIVRQAESIAPEDPRVRGMVPALDIRVRERDGSRTDLTSESSISDIEAFVEEPTVLEERPDLEDIEDATRPMPSPFEISFEGAVGSGPFDRSPSMMGGSVDDSGDEPTVQVSPSLALEAAELVAAGLLPHRPVAVPIEVEVEAPRPPPALIMPRIDPNASDDEMPSDATRPLSIIHSIDLESIDDQTRPLTHPSIHQHPAFRPSATHAQAPPSMSAVRPPSVDAGFDADEPTSTHPRPVPQATTELDSRRLAGPAPLRGLAGTDLTGEHTGPLQVAQLTGRPQPPGDGPPLEPTQELSQIALSNEPGGLPLPDWSLPPVPRSRIAPSIDVELSGAPIAIPTPAEGSLDLPRFEWEMPEVSEDRPGTVQLPKRRLGSSKPDARPVPAGPEDPTRTSRPASRIPQSPRLKSGEVPRPPALPAVRSQAPAPRRDLLDVPLDPAEFKNMPRPAPSAPHALPDDLRTGPVIVAARPAPLRSEPARPAPSRPAPRPVPARPAPPPARPIPRPAPHPAAPRPAPRPAAPRPAPRPAPQRPAPDRAGRSGRAPQPERGPVRGKARPAPPAAARRSRARPKDGMPSTTFAARDRSQNRQIWPYLLAGLVVTLAAVAVTTVIAYRKAMRRADVLHAEAQRELNADTHPGRINATRILEAAPARANILARLGDQVVQVFGSAGLNAPAARRDAVLARVLAERVLRDAEVGLRDRADAALTRATAHGSDLADVQLATLVRALDRRDLPAADAAIEAMPEAHRAQAPVRYHQAVLAYMRGERDSAARLISQALEADAGYVPAELASLREQLERGQHDRALAGYGQLETRLGRHVGAFVERRRAWVLTLHRDAAGVADLKKVLSNAGQENADLSPHQLAMVHETIGLYYLHRDTALGRAELEKAVAAAPEQVHALIGLARLDLLTYQVPEAEARLAAVDARMPNDPEVRVEQARALLLRGDASAAVTLLGRIPSPTLEGLLVEAQARLALSEPAAAATALRRAVPLGKGLSDIVYYQLLADVSAKNKPVSALENLKTMANPKVGVVLWDDALPNRAYGIALMRSNRLKEAVQVLKGVRAAFPQDHQAAAALCMAWRLRFDAKPALAACRAALQVNPYDMNVARLGSRIAEEYADFGAVVALLEPVKGRGPELTRRLARAYATMRDTGKLTDLLRRSGTGSTNAYLTALDLVARNKPAEALAPMAKAAEGLPSDEWVHLSHARLLLAQGDSRGAKKVFTQVAQRSRLPHAQMGLARVALLNNKWNAANTAVRAASKLAKASLSHPRVRAEALALEGRIALSKSGRRGWRTAKNSFRAAARIAKELPELLVGRGLLAEQSRDVDGALRYYGRAVQVSPRDAGAHYLFGRFLLNNTEQRDQAIKTLQKAIDLDPRGRYGDLARRALKGG